MRATDVSLSILSILPKNEGFSPDGAGAIALCVRDFTRTSHYRSNITVIGGAAEGGFTDVRYQRIAPAHWYENNMRAYARGCIKAIGASGAALAEIHNRPRLLMLIAQQVSCKLALHLHNDPQGIDGARTLTERSALLARCDAIYCVSAYVRDRFLEGLSEPERHKLHILYNGIDIPPLTAAKENLIVFAGRMSEDKGAPLLAEALAIALPQMQGWRALFIGSHHHVAGEKPTAVEAEIEGILAPLGTQVERMGFLPHEKTLAFFARAAIAVVPSVWQEPFGRTAIEAMAYGCALISSGRGGLREVTGDAALTLTELTPQALAEALLRLKNDAALRERLAQAGRQRAQAFAIAATTQALDKIRDGLLV